MKNFLVFITLLFAVSCDDSFYTYTDSTYGETYEEIVVPFCERQFTCGHVESDQLCREAEKGRFCELANCETEHVYNDVNMIRCIDDIYRSPCSEIKELPSSCFFTLWQI